MTVVIIMTMWHYRRRHFSTHSLWRHEDVPDLERMLHFLSQISSSLSTWLSNLEILAGYQFLWRNSLRSRLTPHSLCANSWLELDCLLFLQPTGEQQFCCFTKESKNIVMLLNKTNSDVYYIMWRHQQYKISRQSLSYKGPCSHLFWDTL